MNWKDVKGWFEYPSFYKMCFNAVPDNGIMVEVGSWMGRSTACMGELIKNSNKNVEFYAVDTFEGDTFEEQKRIVAELKEQNSSLFELFKNNLKKCGVNEFVIPIQSTSLEAANNFEDNSLDFVHIDASHLYEDVIEDIRAWYPKVKPGGLITGDDYSWPGVQKAVHEFFDSNTIVVCNSDNNYPGQVWACKKEGGISKMNVTLYAIAKNEEKNIEKFIENSKKFYTTVVVDTGSTDNTVQLLRDSGITVYEHPQTKEEFDFSVARNQALSYVETDWAFSLDFNEDVNDFYPDNLDFIQNDITALKHLRFNDDGNGDPQQSQEVHIRFHKKENYKWHNSVHETPHFIPSEKFPEEVSVDTSIKIIKKLKSSISKELFYLSICEREYKKDPTNTFYLWFIFNHYFKIQNPTKTLEYGQEYLSASKAYFDPYRIDAFIRCSMILLNSNNFQQAANYAFHAVSEAMNMGDPYMSQAFSYLTELSKRLDNPNITVFATGFNSQTLSSPERQQAIDKLFLSNLDDIPSTCWNGHRRFAEWLVSYLKPEVTVDLGVDWGYSTFCFAMPRIGHVYGVDSFEGDYYTGKKDDYQFNYVNMKREKLFMDQNVTFIKGYFDDVAKDWDKKIDILHIDGDHRYECVKNDFETWSKFLSDDGVILFHDTCVEEFNNKEYGVKKFFDEIDLPKCTFTHTFGLGVVSKNKNLIELIQNNFDLSRPL
jgi:predicted O-methyltransferase YrrM